MGTWKPAAGTDDGGWTVAGVGFANGDAYHNLGQNYTPDKWSIFVRFPAVTIPQGAIISAAHVTFTNYTAASGTTVNLLIYANDVDDATAPGTHAACDDLVLTTASVAWSPAAWAYATAYDTPDIKTVIQEIVDRALWASGNDLTIVIKDNGSSVGAYRNPFTYDHGNSDRYPELDVTWTAGPVNISINDTVNATESVISRGKQQLKSVFDEVVVSEFVDIIGKVISCTVVDSVMTTELLAPWPKQLCPAVFIDMVNISDSLTVNLDLVGLLYDKVTIVDILNLTSLSPIIVSDDIVISDNIKNSFAHSLHLDDDVIISEYTYGVLKVYGNWMDWKGQVPWSLGVLPDKRRYNEGNEITDYTNPVWKVDHD